MGKLKIILGFWLFCMVFLAFPIASSAESVYNFTQPTFLKTIPNYHLWDSEIIQFEGNYYLLYKAGLYYGFVGGREQNTYFLEKYDSSWTLLDSLDLKQSFTIPAFSSCDGDIYTHYPESCDITLDYVSGTLIVSCENYILGDYNFGKGDDLTVYNISTDLNIIDSSYFANYCIVGTHTEPSLSNFGFGAYADWSFWTAFKDKNDVSKIKRTDGLATTLYDLTMPADTIQVFDIITWQDLGDDSSSKIYLFYTANINTPYWIGKRLLFVNTYTRQTFAFESRTAILVWTDVYYPSIVKKGNVYNFLYQTAGYWGGTWYLEKYDLSWNQISVEALNGLGVPYYKFNFDKIYNTLFNKTFFADFEQLTIHTQYDCPAGGNINVRLRMNITSLDSNTTLTDLDIGQCNGVDLEVWNSFNISTVLGENVYAEVFPDPADPPHNITNIDFVYARFFEHLSYPHLSIPLEELWITFSGRREWDNYHSIWYVNEALPCICGGWVEGGCTELYRRYDRSCYPFFCDIEVNYTYDESCIIPPYYPLEEVTEDESEWTNPGETAVCTPPSIEIPENAVNITSNLFTQIQWETAANVPGTFELESCNPSAQCILKTHGDSPDCSDAEAKVFYDSKDYNDYVPGSTASARAEAEVLDCIGRGKFKLICSFTVNYIEPCSEKWVCTDSLHKALLHEDCSTDNVTFCTYGCSLGECEPEPTISPIADPIKDWIEMAGQFLNDLFPDLIMKSIFWIFLMIGIAGAVGYKADSWQLAMIIAFALMLLGAFIGWLPLWIAIVFIILAGVALTRMVIGGLE